MKTCIDDYIIAVSVCTSALCVSCIMSLTFLLSEDDDDDDDDANAAEGFFRCAHLC